MARKKAADESGPLVSFIPAHDFTGYPFGQKVDFKAGTPSIPVPADYALLMREKGHVAASQTVSEQD